MAQLGWRFRPRWQTDDTKEDESGVYALHTLKRERDHRPAGHRASSGSICPTSSITSRSSRQIAAEPQAGRCPLRRWRIWPQIFENRRQYPRAADYWRQLLQRLSQRGRQQRQLWQQRLDQIVGNWGRFEPTQTQPAGRGATRRIPLPQRPTNRVHGPRNQRRKAAGRRQGVPEVQPPAISTGRRSTSATSAIGWSQENQQQYLGRQVAQWQMTVKPREKHFDKRVTVTTPLQKPGAYLLTAKMEGGNTQLHRRLGRRHGDRQEAAGRQDLLLRRRRRHRPPDRQGQRRVLRLAAGSTTTIRRGTKSSPGSSPNSPTPTARSSPIRSQQPPELSVAHHRADRRRPVRLSRLHRRLVRATGTTPSITPRRSTRSPTGPSIGPIRRLTTSSGSAMPSTTWTTLRSLPTSDFTVEIHNPKGEKIVSDAKKADAYGGIEGQYALSPPTPRWASMAQRSDRRHGLSAAAASASRSIRSRSSRSRSMPRPSRCMLGEKITATIKAKYYFGSPVTKAKVKYKVNRTSYDERWYPAGPWDWLYGPGYWWFAYDYSWYPGWHDWGCPRPDAVLVAASAAAARVGRRSGSGNRPRRHRESRDRHRRGQGHPSRSGPKLHDHRRGSRPIAADDRRHGHGAGRPQAVFGLCLARSRLLPRRRYDRRPFSARTLDGKPVEGHGELQAAEISYKDGKPVETPVQTWPLDTNAEGTLSSRLPPRKPDNTACHTK